MVKYLVISENALYNLGGAERSMFQYCKENSNFDDTISVMCCNQDISKLDYGKLECDCYENIIDVRFLRILKKFTLIYSQFVILFNLFKIMGWLKNHDVVLTQNRWAPYVTFLSYLLRLFNQNIKLKVVYFVRDEKCLAYYKCYSFGWRKAFWYTRHLLETPFRILHKKFTKFAFCHSKVVFNSYFMKSFAINLKYDLPNFEIEYPRVENFDVRKCEFWITKQTQEIQSLYNYRKNNIVLVGGEIVKGIMYFEDLSNVYPNVNFLNFSKSVQQIYKVKNRIYFPWQDIPGVPYFMAQTLIVPSIWIEAFGRVVVEAKQFNCNILVSNKGGLLEALGDYENGYVCDDFSGFAKCIDRLIK